MCTTKRLVFATLLMVMAAHRVDAAPTDCGPPQLQLELAPSPCCACPCAALDAQERSAHEELGMGLALFVPAYVAGTVYAWSLPRSVRAVDGLPVFGALVAGARDRERDNHAGLLFSGGLQLIGAFLVVLAAVDLGDVRERRWAIDVATGPGSARLSAQLRW